MTSERVTIAIPTYKRLRYLKQALDSALSQTYPHLEVIVSDNRSDDGTAAYLASIKDDRLVVLQQTTNLGMIGNWNACLERATGEFFLLLSDDDLLRDRAVEKLVAAIVEFRQPESVGFAYCRGWVIDHEGTPISLDPVAPPAEDAREFALEFFRKKREIRPCATLLRTQDIRDVGGYMQGGVMLAVDAMVWSRILQKRRTAVSVADPLAEYRVHPTNTSVSGQVRIWQNDLRTLAALWAEDFRGASPLSQRQLRNAARGHEAWMVAVTINQCARTYWDRLGLLKAYVDCRSSFSGVNGMRNLLLGLLKLLVPNGIKKPIRDLLIWWGRPPKAAAGSS